MTLYPEYDNLRIAIVEQAVRDYKRAYKTKNLAVMAECESFFRSDWFTFLTGVDCAQNVINTLAIKCKREMEERERLMKKANKIHAVEMLQKSKTA